MQLIYLFIAVDQFSSISNIWETLYTIVFFPIQIIVVW